MTTWCEHTRECDCPEPDDWDYCHEPIIDEQDGPIPTVGLDDTDTAELPIDEGNTPPF